MPSSSPIDPRALRTAIAVLVGGIAVILDSTIVAVALHDLATDLHVGIATIQWVSTAYLLALGVSIPLVGWLQGRLGAKRLWIAGLLLFLLGSVLCSLAWDASSLIAFRIVQGIGGGVMMPLMTTMVMQAAKGPDRARLTAVVALPAAVGPIVGPVIGGLILGVAHWPWLFLVNVPLCLVGAVLAWKLIPEDQPTPGTRLDIVGLLLLAPALAGLLWGLSNVSAEGGFGHPDVLVPVLVGAALLTAFALWALRRGDRALVELSVLRSRPTWAATVLLFLCGAALFGAMLLLPLWFQGQRSTDALGAGLLLIPQGVGALLSRGAAPRLMERLGGRGVTLLGFIVVGLATIPFALADAGTATWVLMVALFVRGLGLGIVVIPLMTMAFTELPHQQVPHASIVLRIAQQVGGSIGVALLAVILAMATETSGSATTGFQTAFWWSTAFTAVAVALSFLLPSSRRPTGGTAPSSPAEPAREPRMQPQ